VTSQGETKNLSASYVINITAKPDSGGSGKKGGIPGYEALPLSAAMVISIIILGPRWWRRQGEPGE